ncbi:hypothetical protein EKO27_g7731 [Xylaria grammica]|uniref:Uncharacterized protein n=1 Tax=Xylaria grammica TaxID=363999 RepID=A0A439CYR9_9PEZI|nr:hypothetical protein EKO27_g7731 [Xylaria grammica]
MKTFQALQALVIMPSLEIDSATGGAHIQCLPSFATEDDFNESPIFTYSPGLFCPSGMTTGTSVSGTAICCPSGLECTDIGRDATFYKCTATMTVGTFGEGEWGENPDIGYIFSISVLSPKFHKTIYAEATAITLLRQGADNSGDNSGDNSDGVSDTQTGSSDSITSTAMASDPTTTQLGPTNTFSPRSSSDTAKIVGIVLGSVIGVILLFLLYFFFVRYRPRQLRKRNADIQPDAAQENGTSGPQPYPGDSAVGFWNLKSELDPAATRAELEGTEIDRQGPGIYVVKPELEGSVVAKRTTQMLDETQKHVYRFHAIDPELRRQRDMELSRTFDPNSNWTHPTEQEWIWSYDAYKEAEDLLSITGSVKPPPRAQHGQPCGFVLPVEEFRRQED